MSRKWRSSKERFEDWVKGVRGGEGSDGKMNCFSVSLFRQLQYVSGWRLHVDKKHHLSEQYSTALQGTIICFSQVALVCVSCEVEGIKVEVCLGRTRTAGSSWP